MRVLPSLGSPLDIALAPSPLSLPMADGRELALSNVATDSPYPQQLFIVFARSFSRVWEPSASLRRGPSLAIR